eukprot:TRINITY_DN6885_c0_g1_i1.p1 TRINITY_DN6885_c0_g1~~TRINITY_DN6885_c0_g1_i1.p1  ORF type:complete len:438 (+),score=49.70 TRINITY_DN6885_c0_g1_i1:28-1314(+)
MEPKTHPCEKLGPCKFGPTCKYAAYPISACVFSLRGRCTVGPKCRYDHISEQDFTDKTERFQRCEENSKCFTTFAYRWTTHVEGKDKQKLQQRSGSREQRAGQRRWEPAIEDPASGDDVPSAASKRARPDQPFGNFTKYYRNYRAKPTDGDHRLGLLDAFADRFRGGKVLDIGCNVGEFTLAFAQRFFCHTFGEDLDAQLISRAQHELCRYVQLPPLDHFPISCIATLGPLPSPVAFTGAVLHSGFRLRDWSAETAERAFPVESFDGVLCLSVTKWIHVNSGDAGIKRLFERIHTALKPGGTFVLEPQPWSSYRKKLPTYSEEQKANFFHISLRPQQFPDYLVTTFGFQLLASLSPKKSSGEDGAVVAAQTAAEVTTKAEVAGVSEGVSDTAAHEEKPKKKKRTVGFERDIFVFVKPERPAGSPEATA